MASVDSEIRIDPSKSNARRSLYRENVPSLTDSYSPRLFTKKQLLLLQQQRQYNVEDQYKHNIMNSRRVYPPQYSYKQQLLMRTNADYSTDCSSHGSPARRVPKKMVVDEKQLAMKLLRARNAIVCSSSSSSSSSESASLRASTENMERAFPRSHLSQMNPKSDSMHQKSTSRSSSSSSSASQNNPHRASAENVEVVARTCPIEHSRRTNMIVSNGKHQGVVVMHQRVPSSSSSRCSLVSQYNPYRASAESHEVTHRTCRGDYHMPGYVNLPNGKTQMITLMRQKSAHYTGTSRFNMETDPATNAEEKKTMTVACVSSGRSSDAEESVRRVRDGCPMHKPATPVLLRSASCSSAASSSTLSKLVRLKAADMPLGMQEHAFYCTNEVLNDMDKLHCKRVAWALKKEFDKAYGPAWHCIVGTSFGSYVTHSVGGFLYFSIGKVSVLLFQTAVELIEHH